MLSVERSHVFHGLGGERLEFCCAHILQDLLRVFPPWDCTGHGRMVDNEAKRPLTQGCPFGDQLPQVVHETEPQLVGDSGECLTDIEGLSVAIEIAMVISFERRVGLELSCEES